MAIAGRTRRPVLEKDKCRQCDICRFLCPDLAITRDTKTGEVLIDLAYCKGCGICAAVCPKKTITMELEG